MFKVLTGEKKRRAISPATIAASIAAHLLLLGGVVYAAAGETGPVEIVDREIEIEPLAPEPNEPPPPPPVVEQPAPPAPADDQPVEPAPVQALEIPVVTEVPNVLPVEPPATPPINPDDFHRDGRRGPAITTPPAGPTGPVGPPTPTQPVTDMIPTEDMVEVRPVLDRNRLGSALERNYPPVLRDARVSGRVVIELIVDENGQPRPGSARVIEASHPAFGEAALRAVDRFRFRPARIAGTPVPVRVTIPIQWTVPN